MKYLILFLTLFFLVPSVKSQDFLNGDFEINTAGFDQINLANVTFNSFMSNTTAFGTVENMDIVTSNTYCGLAQSNAWFVCLTGGETDAITMELSTPLIAGQEYTITFWDKGCGQFSSGPLSVKIGVSSSPTSVGTNVYTGPTPTESVWTQRTATFIAPSSDIYISASLISSGGGGDTGFWTQIDNFAFSTPTCPEVVDLGPDQILCTGETADFSVNIPNATYEWNDGSTNGIYSTNITEEVYVIATVDDCVYSDTVNITVANPPVIDLGDDVELCAGESYIWDATTPNATYLWQDGSTDATYTASLAGTYTVTVSIGNCSATDDVELIYSAIIPVNLGIDQTLCEGESLVLDVTQPGQTYVWQDGSTSGQYAVTTSGTYSVTVTQGDCSGTDEVQIDFDEAIAIELGNDTTICYNDVFFIGTNIANAQYAWNTGFDEAILSVTQAGEYSVTVTKGACEATDSIQIEEIAAVDPILTTSAACIPEGGVVTIKDIHGLEDLVWSTGEIADSISVQYAGIYTATFENVCETIDISVAVVECPILYVYVPNCFTPDANDLNEVFKPSIYVNFELDSYQFTIFNRWGEVVYETNNIRDAWDGGMLGSRYYVPDGTYDWIMTLEYSGDVVHKSGSVLIIR